MSQESQQVLFRRAFKGRHSVLVEQIDFDHGLCTELKTYGVLTDEHIEECSSQITKNKRIRKMLELLERREDEHFEGFCKALEANDQAGIVKRHLQQHRVMDLR